MNYQALIPSFRQWLTPPVFPDKEQTRAARWLNFLCLTLIVVLVLDSIAILSGILDQKAMVPILITNTIGLLANLATLILMRRGYFNIATLVSLSMSFALITYTNAFVFQSARTPSISGYFVLIPLAGLLLGRRSMNYFATVCLLTISFIFYLELVEILTPSTGERSIVDDLVVIILATTVMTVLLNASIKRVEEKANEIHHTATALTIANQQLQVSQTQLQEARTELEQKVQQRTYELQESNRKLQQEVEERQRVLDALATSEANWRSLAEQVPAMIARINPDYTVAFINRTIGVHSPRELIGTPITAIYQQTESQGLLRESIKTVFQTGKTVSYESEERSELSHTWHINQLGPIWQEGKIVAMILIVTDITEQKRTEAAMYQMQKLESLGVLAGGIAHDFNNLLSVMLMQLSLGLTKVSTDHPVRQNLERTLKAAERATELTRQMLNYAGRSPTEAKPLNLNELIMDNIHLFSASVSKNVKISAELLDTTPLMIGDRGQLQQLIMNLIINSADAIGGKSGDIRVVTKIQELMEEEAAQGEWFGASLAAGCYIRLEVHDTGCGMDVQTLRKIFDPFFTTKFTGRGLGLASVLGIVRAHKGGLRVTSVVNQGTSFTILFPRVKEALSTDPLLVTTPFTGAGELVLVIDDEAEVCEGMTNILSHAGLNVLSTTDGATGLHLFREHRHELRLVLLDLAMPGMNGEEVFHQLLAIDNHVPIMLVSGYSEADVMDRFINKRLAGFVQKPYTAEALLQHVQAHLHTTGQAEENIGAGYQKGPSRMPKPKIGPSSHA